MRPRNSRRNRVLELGVIMLIMDVLNVGFDAIPPVTLITIISQALLYVGIINVPWSKWDVCISAKKVLDRKDYRSLIFSTFEHADDMHLYYNMVSFLVKGRTLEYQYGSANFGILLGIMCILTSSMYVFLARLGAQVLLNDAMLSSCAIGFSGVIFALKLVTTLENPIGHQTVYGIRIPTRYAAWAELLAIHFLVPNASFLGHLAGILAGLIYMKTYVGTFIDYLIYSITGQRMVHSIGWNYEQPRNFGSSRNFGWNNNWNSRSYRY